jgi:hypothetical protein
VTPKAERANTLPSDDGAEEVAPRGVPVDKPAVSVSAPTVVADGGRRRWALAAAPGVALLLGLALYVSFGGSGPDADATAVDAEAARPAAVPNEEPVEDDSVDAFAPKQKAEPTARTLVEASPSSSADAPPAASTRVVDNLNQRPSPPPATPPMAEPEHSKDEGGSAPPKPPPPPPVQQEQPQPPPQLQLQGVE